MIFRPFSICTLVCNQFGHIIQLELFSVSPVGSSLAHELFRNMLFYFWRNQRSWFSVHLCWCLSVLAGGWGPGVSGHAGLEGPGCCKLHCVTCGLSSGHHLSAVTPLLN